MLSFCWYTFLQITTEGRPYLGAPWVLLISHLPLFKIRCLCGGILSWIFPILPLVNPMLHFLPWFMVYHPNGLFFTRTVCDLSSFLAPLEGAIHFFVAQALPPSSNDSKQAMLALPIQLWGLGIFNSCKSAQDNYQFSVSIISPLVLAILNQFSSFDSLYQM